MILPYLSVPDKIDELSSVFLIRLEYPGIHLLSHIYFCSVEGNSRPNSVLNYIMKYFVHMYLTHLSIPLDIQARQAMAHRVSMKTTTRVGLAREPECTTSIYNTIRHLKLVMLKCLMIGFVSSTKNFEWKPYHHLEKKCWTLWLCWYSRLYVIVIEIPL